MFAQERDTMWYLETLPAQSLFTTSQFQIRGLGESLLRRMEICRAACLSESTRGCKRAKPTTRLDCVRLATTAPRQ